MARKVPASSVEHRDEQQAGIEHALQRTGETRRRQVCAVQETR